MFVIANPNGLVGPIYEVRLSNENLIVVSNHEIYNELCDESRFTKGVNIGLKQLRPLMGDGLFSARKGEPNWGIAHRVLVPALGPLSVANMFDGP